MHYGLLCKVWIISPVPLSRHNTYHLNISWISTFDCFVEIKWLAAKGKVVHRQYYSLVYSIPETWTEIPLFPQEGSTALTLTCLRHKLVRRSSCCKFKDKNYNSHIHPFIFFRFSGVRLQGEESKQGNPATSSSSSGEDPEMFPGIIHMYYSLL